MSVPGGWAPVLAALAAAALTPLWARLAVRLGVVDEPNERTSHRGAVPRGGGVAIALPVLAYVLWARAAGVLDDALALSLLVGAGGVAAVGLLTDAWHLPFWLRLALWTPPLAWVLAAHGWMATLDLGLALAPLGAGGAVLALLGGLWLVTLYNFMDGIDGLAAGQGVVTAAAAALILHRAGDGGTAAACLVLAGASAGFLAWNLRPATVFMGDVGSLFLGGAFAVLALSTEARGAMPMLAWLILLMPFLVDATFTLVRRVASGADWRRPHRDHAYQRMVRAGLTHRHVAARILALDLALAALAILAATWPPALVPASLAAFAVTAFAWRWAARRVQ